MPECLVDAIATPIDFILRKWREALDLLDQRHFSERRAVAVVRFEGVNQPSFREASQLRRATLGMR
jgi:hypothetical protein